MFSQRILDKYAMNTSASLHKRTTLHFIVLCIVFSAFTADVLDLRDEIYLLSCPYTNPDDNVSTGLTGDDPFKLEQLLEVPFLLWKVPANISFLHRFSCGYRAPPYWS
jgi:hypothetical protein